MKLSAVGGLCNRTAAIIGYRAKHGPLTVVWKPDEYVAGGRWADVFAPLEGITFVDEGPHDVEAYAQPEDAPEDWDMAYRELKPRYAPILPEREYDAVHIRRTDFHDMIRKYHGVYVPTDHEIAAWAEQSNRPIWIATDNAETQRKWERILSPRGVVAAFIGTGAEIQEERDHRRHTSLRHAVWDLFACAGAVRFLGSTLHSTFTHTIERLRLLRAQQ